jgi:hypothetical protein
LGEARQMANKSNPALISLIPKDDPNYPAAKKMPDDPTICLVISHGSNVTVNHMYARSSANGQ